MNPLKICVSTQNVSGCSFKKKLNWQRFKFENIYSLLNKNSRSPATQQWLHNPSCPSALWLSASWFPTLSLHDCKAAAGALGVTATFKGKGVCGSSKHKLSSCTCLFYQHIESFPEATAPPPRNLSLQLSSWNGQRLVLAAGGLGNGITVSDFHLL